MALIECPECKQKISDTAISCPHCGRHKRKRVSISSSIFFIIGIVASLIFSGLVWGGSGNAVGAIVCLSIGAGLSTLFLRIVNS